MITYKFWEKNHRCKSGTEARIQTTRTALKAGVAEEDIVWFGLAGLPQEEIDLTLAAAKLLEKWGSGDF